MATAATTNIENAIAKIEGIKWMHARDLSNQARETLVAQRNSNDEAPTKDEIIEEACNIYRRLTPPEQESMKQQKAGDGDDGSGEEVVESDFVRRAREAAERREREWAEEAERERRKQELADQNGGKLPEYLPDSHTKKTKKGGVISEETTTTTTEITHQVTTKPKQQQTEKAVEVKQVTCYCTIL